MAGTNEVTGDSLITGAASEDYRKGYDRIFGEPCANRDQPQACWSVRCQLGGCTKEKERLKAATGSE